MGNNKHCLHQYKVIKDFPNYGISRDGEVINYKLNRKLTPQKESKGYVHVILYKNGRGKTNRIHRLLSEAYIENVNNYPMVNHINGIKTDNRIENLEWCTSSQNNKHAYRIGLKSGTGEKNPASKLTEAQILEIRNSSLSKKELAVLYNVGYHTIYDIIKRKNWKHI
jgi:hypothetical protein